MPDPDVPSRAAEPAGVPNETRNLPALITRPAEQEREGFFARLVRALFGWKNGATRSDIQVVLEAAGPGDAGVSPEELTMIRNILALRGRRIDDVMVPRGDIVAVQQDISLGELVKVFQKAGHSRLVVFNDTLDDPVGMVHIRDLIAFMTDRAAVSPDRKPKRKKPRPADLDLGAIDLGIRLSSTKIMRDILFAPPSMPALDLLAKMQATRIHLALVIDEYGGTDGLVSMEDIVEQIVGEIADEHDEVETPAVVAQTDGSFIADARTKLDDVTAAIGMEFDVGEAAEEVDTIGGYLMARVGRLPLRGELIPGPKGFEIEVLDSDPRRIKRIRIHRSKDRPAGRDRDGQRRPGGSDAASPAISAAPAAAPAPSAAAEEAGRNAFQSTEPNTPRKP